MAVIDPIEAGQGITNAKMFDTDVDMYIKNRKKFDSMFDQAIMPTTAPKPVADYMERGVANASAVKDDIDTLSMVDKFWKRLNNRNEQSDFSRDMTPLIFKKMDNGGILNDSDDAKLEGLRMMQEEVQQDKDYDPIANFPIELYGSGKDMVMGVYENWGKVAGAAGTGALIGSPGGIPGALTGAIWAGGLATRTAIGYDTYQQTTAQIYGELDTFIDPKTNAPSNLSNNDKIYLAKGAGALVASVDFFADKALAKFIPYVGGVLSPKSLVKAMANTEFSAAMKIIGKAMAQEGSTEVLQEAIQLIAEEAGKSWDGENPVSIWSGIKSAGNDLGKTGKRLGTAMVLGGIGGGVVSGVGTGVAKLQGKTLKAEVPPVEQQPNPDIPPTIAAEPVIDTTPVEQNLKEALDNQLHLVQVAEVVKNTTLYKNAPEDAKSLRTQIMTQNGGPQHQYVDTDDLTNYMQESQANADRVYTIIGEQDMKQADIGAPLQIPMSKVMELVEADPKLAAYFSRTPETPSVFAIENKRQDLINPPDYKENVQNEVQHMDQAIFTETLAKNIPAVSKDKQIKDITEARQVTVDAINTEAEREMSRVTSTVTEMAMIAEQEQLEAEIRNNRDVQVVDQQKQFNITINPKSLTPAQVSRFETDRTLRKRKVFSDKGMNVKDAARMFGIPNGDLLLDILANVPDSKEAVQKILDSRLADVAIQAKDSVNLNETAIIKAYEGRSLIHSREMRYMLDHAWPTVKKGIKQIALPFKTIAEFRNNAMVMTDNTKVKDLNVNRWKVGERKSLRQSVNAILKNQVEHAYQMKERAIQNNEFARATALAIGKVNRNVKYLKRILDSLAVEQDLRRAGPKFYAAFAELADTFNLHSDYTGRSIPGAYQKFVKLMKDHGQGDFSIDPGLFAGLPTTVKLEDLTVKQVDTLVQAFKGLIKQAESFRENYQETKAVADEASMLLAEHPKYDPRRLTSPIKEVGIKAQAAAYWSKTVAMLSPISFIAQELDMGKIGGFFFKKFYLDVKKGEALAKLNGAKFKKKYAQAIKAYGEKEFNKLGNTVVEEIPEFANSRSLKNGKGITKGELFMMMTHWGEMDGRERLENFGVSREDIFAVAQRYLTTKDMDFIQNAIWGGYKDLKSQVRDLELRTKGIEPEFIEPASFVFNNKEYTGGHMPAYYDSEIDINFYNTKAEAETNAKLGLARSKMSARYASNGMTKAGYLRERIGSEQRLSLDPETIAIGFDEVLWDVNMREPLKKAMGLLTDSQISNDIISTVGKEKFNVMYNTLLEATHSPLAQEYQLFSEQKSYVNKMLSMLDRNFAITHLAGNLGSIFIQPLSLLTSLERMGPLTGSKHLCYALGKMAAASSWGKWGEMRELVRDINPDVDGYMQEVSDMSVTGLNSIQFKDRKFKAKPYLLVKDLQEGLNNVLMNKALGFPDQIQKYVIAVAAYSQHLAGEAPGQTIESMAGMTEEERIEAAKEYARSISLTTLTTTSSLDKAAVQKIPLLRELTKFWNDSRSQLNNAFQVNRNIGYNLKKIKKAVKEGEIDKAIGLFDDTASNVFSMLTIVTTSMLFQKMLRQEKDDGPPLDDPLAWLSHQSMNFLEYRYGNITPGVRDVVRGLKLKLDSEAMATSVIQVVPPQFKVIGDLGMSAWSLLSTVDFAMLTPAEQKSVISGYSYLTGGFPIGVAQYIYENLETIATVAIAPVAIGVNQIAQLKEGLNKRLEANRKSEEPLNPTQEQTIQYMEELYAEMVAAEPIDPKLEAYIVKLKKAENRPQDPNKIQGVSSAMGIYQITQDTWQGIINNNPKANLPEYKAKKNSKGVWVADGPIPTAAQQEVAFRLLVKEHMAAMKAEQKRDYWNSAKYEATDENLYAMHFLGQDNGLKFLGASLLKDMEDVLGREAWLKVIGSNENMKVQGVKKPVRLWRVIDMQKWVEATINKK